MTYMDKPGRYPDVPGFRPGAPDTSREAAEAVADAARTRSTLALAYINGQGLAGATADEVADALEWERYSSRPRLAELHKRGEIVDSGERRKGVSGRSQSVWIGKAFAPRADDSQGDLLTRIEGGRMSNVVPLKSKSARRESHGLIHVLAQEDGLEVHHESASGGSYALLARFGLDEREAAVRAALDALPTYAPCRLGEVPKWA